MSHLAQHIRTRLVDGRVIAKSPTDRRLALRTIFRLATSTELLAVSLVEAHLHLLAHCSRAAASKLAHRVEVGLKARLGLPVGFAMYPHEPVRDMRHLRYAFRYVLNQHTHHGVTTDPLREGTNLQDLLGLRLVGRDTRTHVRRWLPQITRAQLLGWLDVEALDPADGPLEWVYDAACSAACLPSLAGKAPAALDARRAVVEVVAPRLSPGELAGILNISDRALLRLRERPPVPHLVHALCLQLALRAQRSARGGTPSDAQPSAALWGITTG